MDYTIVIDYQYDFTYGSLRNEEAIKIKDNVIKRIKEGYDKNNHIIFTRDTHKENYLDTPEGKKLPIPHCILGTLGHELDKDVLNYIKDKEYTIIDKPTFGYLNWNLESPKNIYLLGVCTDICVISNALILKAKYPSANIYLYKDAVAGLTKESNEAALIVAKNCQVEII